MTDIKNEIKEIVDRETTAWNNQDVELLLTVFHKDMVWPWPKDAYAHDPVDWIMEFGRFNYERWKNNWQELFNTHDLIHNNRNIIKIEISKEGDGAFAVVDIDTLWRNKLTGEDFHWEGRACKVYTLQEDEWKMIMHTGLLEY